MRLQAYSGLRRLGTSCPALALPCLLLLVKQFERYLVDVNAAPTAEIEALPGVGPVLAERIVAERSRAPFAFPLSWKMSWEADEFLMPSVPRA